MSDAFDLYRQLLAIPPGILEPNHYELLGIARFESNPDQIAQAADRAVAKISGLRSGSSPTSWAQLLNRVTAATTCLLDAAAKAKYDGELRKKTSKPQASAVKQLPRAVALEGPAPSLPEPVSFVVVLPPSADGPVVPSPILPPMAGPMANQISVPMAPVLPAPSFVATAPGPVATPTPFATAASEAPAEPAVRSNSAALQARRYAKQVAQRQMMAMVAGGVLLLAGVGLIVVLGNLGVFNPGPGQGKLPPTPSPPVVPPNPRPPKPEPDLIPTPDPMPGDTTEPDEMPQPEPMPKPPMDSRPAPETEPEPTPQELAALSKCLKTAREALSEYNVDDADTALVEAAAVAKLDDHQAKVDRLTELAGHVRAFWQAVDEGRQGLEAGEELVVGKTRIAIVDAGPGKFKFKAQGKDYDCDLHDIPVNVAIVLAHRSLNENAASTKVLLGAIHAVNKKVDKTADARRSWEEAIAGGVDVSDLLLVLDDTYDFTPETP